MLARNKKAFHDYEIIESFEAGISLLGGEVKSVRDGKISLKEGWVDMVKGEALLREVHISPYKGSRSEEYSQTRVRRLLLKKREIRRLHGKVSEKGFSVVPLKVYLKHGWIKCEIALGRGKKYYDKRAREKEKQDHRDIQRALKNKQQLK
ncbi:MAG: SsrA-binding protein SmpB [Proteobacteria bacterium]|nr:SsrA-binding protein SmpB [Pseudomonadota bacterium]